MSTLCYATKLSEHRGTRRIWLEGVRLERAGIRPGARFTVRWDPDARTVRIRFEQAGDRVVSRKGDRPVIDISSRQVVDTLGGAERARITIRRDEIVVSVHPDDAARRERLERLADRIARNLPLRTGSIAHGGGILDHAVHEGMKRAGVDSELSFAIEIDRATIEHAAIANPIWTDRTLMVHAPLEEVEPELLGKVEALVMGIPCVGASRSGRAKNGAGPAEAHATAGMLIVPALAIVKATQPAVVILENVPEYAASASAMILRRALEIWGYDVHERILAGGEFGAIENRRRMALVAVTSGIPFDIESLVPVRRKEASLGEILEDIPADSDRWKSAAFCIAKEERDRAKGSNFKRQVVSADTLSIGAIGAGYWKYRPTEPMIEHPDDTGRVRILTPREHARAKTVPESLIQGLSSTMAHTVLGNSVIHAAWVSLGEAVAAALRAAKLARPPRPVQLSLVA